MKKGEYQVAKWNGTKVSVKILDKESYSDPDSINAFKHELTLLEKVRHPNVVQFVGAVTQNIPMMIVSEYHHKVCSIFDSLITRGMNYLHQCKPEPVIHCIYSAPEICRNEIFDGSVDTYSFGVILYEMIEGAQPFHNKAREDAVKLICLEGKDPI
ncbi:hypothetical protein HPP92_007071 [Vanilla planifolia]|uniref:Protein kinase domain-containing protein n=1 Tax=Vanilla planifolia TaxID=51239 RepID=A0A835V923_VANPL|nr:hypothetical protein HPP92_007071 [Vanilla planifolia]